MSAKSIYLSLFILNKKQSSNINLSAFSKRFKANYLREQQMIVYPIVHNWQRRQQVQSKKAQYINYHYHFSRRYLREQQHCNTKQHHYNPHSVYVKHKQLMRKYDYDYDLMKCGKILKEKKQEFSFKLYKYLIAFGSGKYQKKKSDRDKCKLKEKLNFKMKMNPLSRMVELLQRMDTKLIIFAFFESFRKAENDYQQQKQREQSEQPLKQIDETQSNDKEIEILNEKQHSNKISYIKKDKKYNQLLRLLKVYQKIGSHRYWKKMRILRIYKQNHKNQSKKKGKAYKTKVHNSAVIYYHANKTYLLTKHKAC